MAKGWMENFSKPRGFAGRMILASMNWGHAGISRWGLSQLAIRPGDHILDIGCGGGANVARMLKRAVKGRVCGLDHSEASVEKTMRLNRKAVAAGRSEIRLGGVSENPWPDNAFDIVTAFETVYFWPDFAKDLLEVRRVLKPGGLFFICNEMYRLESAAGSETDQPYQYWIKSLDLKVYTKSEFQQYLAGAGFTDTAFACKGKTSVCVSAQAKK